ncbi:uncharacterized protein LOC143153827 isoform X2 [Ptiloglossa arizonensis]|uniref:uncharacterized protein LOC143153827 isoform X2 n=1 Tax=Ptiloglossa arizonensis TaxID=3350558 RepID=UPI003FA0DD73
MFTRKRKDVAKKKVEKPELARSVKNSLYSTLMVLLCATMYNGKRSVDTIRREGDKVTVCERDNE